VGGQGQVGKITTTKKNVKGQQPKRFDCAPYWLKQFQEVDEETWPILWTERPTGAVMGDWFTLAVFGYLVGSIDWWILVLTHGLPGLQKIPFSYDEILGGEGGEGGGVFTPTG